MTTLASVNLAILGAAAVVITIQTIRVNLYETENIALKSQIESVKVDLESAKAKKIIEYKDRKVEIIKKVPYKDDSCEAELESYKRLINAF